ncbi:hypothetical protein FB45DRAFT_522705 [Roridomyces roridus]|uniref:SH3 domain-containing protein n=1 Tax=Roridomyces roridus TaxID=1738132 RepID=A0AAD7FRC8_9AGAR|nr:hypothetical protein FB45DRAFT_522705 [Roridomyces roridus]
MMHSNMRRLPVDRARHKKRLARDDLLLPRDLVIGGTTFTGPITITRTFPVNPDTTTSTSLLTSASQTSSSDSIPPALPTDTTPAAPSAPAVPSAPAAPSAPSAPPALTPATPSQPVASAIASPPGTNSAAADRNGVSGVSTDHSLPTGAIVGITIACVILLLGALLFFIRQRAIRNRRQRQSTWQPARPMGTAATPAGGMMQTSMSPGVSFAQLQNQSLMGTMPTPPPSSYNNPVPPPMPFSAGAAGSSSAAVVYEFIPTLPDELSITTGEVVRVVSEFDDGWALCANTRGEQGMVPLECLNRGSSLAVNNSSSRDSRRTSSLGVRI